MRLYQHIYGTVSRGYRSGSEGYQVAGMSEKLASHPGLVEKLNRCSFFRAYPGEGNPVRYSFFRPSEDFLAFGAACMARDMTGSLGTFAHNYVCETEEFLSTAFSPVGILRKLSFVFSEAEIQTEDRRLPTTVLETVAPAAVPAVGKWRELALYLLSVLREEQVPTVPVVSLSEADTWDLLFELFQLVPQLEASRMTFSTLFLNASEWLDAFRVVFVPDRLNLPRNQKWYQIVDSIAVPEPRLEPLSAFWKCAWEKGASDAGPALVRWLNAMRPPTKNFELARQYTPTVLGLGKAFRDVVEKLNPPCVYSLMAENREWLVAFGRAGQGFDPGLLAEAVWENPAANLLPALDACAQIRDTALVQRLLLDLARRLAGGSAPVTLLGNLDNASLLSTFYRIAGAPEGLSDYEMQALAERLAEQSLYSGQIHRAFVERIFSGIVEGKRSEIAEHWIVSQSAGIRPDPLVRTLALLLTYRRGQGLSAPPDCIEEAQYLRLMEAAWTLLPTLREWITAVYPTAHRVAFFEFCATRLATLETEGQKNLLDAIAANMQPSVRENNILVGAVLQLPRAWEVGRHFADTLERVHCRDEQGIARLKSIPKPSLVRRFL